MNVIELGKVVLRRRGHKPPGLDDEVDGFLVSGEDPSTLTIGHGDRPLVRDADSFQAGFSVVQYSVPVPIFEDEPTGHIWIPETEGRLGVGGVAPGTSDNVNPSSTLPANNLQGVSLVGLPVTGFSAYEFENDFAEGGDVKAYYGGLFGHKASVRGLGPVATPLSGE